MTYTFSKVRKILLLIKLKGVLEINLRQISNMLNKVRPDRALMRLLLQNGLHVHQIYDYPEDYL